MKSDFKFKLEKKISSKKVCQSVSVHCSFSALQFQCTTVEQIKSPGWLIQLVLLNQSYFFLIKSSSAVFCRHLSVVCSVSDNKPCLVMHFMHVNTYEWALLPILWLYALPKPHLTLSFQCMNLKLYSNDFCNSFASFNIETTYFLN